MATLDFPAGTLICYPTTVVGDAGGGERVRGPGGREYALGVAAACLLRGGRVALRSRDPEGDRARLAGRLPRAGSNDRSAGLRTVGGGRRGAGGGWGTEGRGGVRPVFGDYPFAATVGLWLPYGRHPAALLLDPFISTEGFDFTPAEFVDLRQRLAAARRRYERLPAPGSGLDDLNTGFFRHRSLAESTEVITGHLTDFLGRGAALHRAYLLALNAYARAAAFEHRANHREQTAAVSGLLAAVRELTATGLSARERKRRLKGLADRWAAYRRRHHHQATPPPNDAEALLEAVAAEDEALGEAARRSNRDLRAAGLALSPLTARTDLGDPARLAELARELQDLVRGVNEAGLYQLPVGGAEAATTPRQLRQLETLLARLRNTRRHLGELPLFYDRRHFWYAQPAHLRRLLAPLLDLPYADWEPAFSAWYFERCLERVPDPGADFLPSDATPVPPAGLPPAAALDRLLVLRPESEPPPGPFEVYLDFTGGAGRAPRSGRSLTLAPLHDRSARHYALSGHRAASLSFVQVFHPVRPPAWTVHVAATPPAGADRGVLVQRSEEEGWLPLAGWDGRTQAELKVFLPRILAPADGEVFLDRWEDLLSAPALHFYHDQSSADLTQALLTDGFTPDFLAAALLRAAEAALMEPFDREAFVALGREVRLRCGLPEPAPHPLGTAYATVLAETVPAHLLANHVAWRDAYLPLTELRPNGKKVVYLPDGRLHPLTDPATERRLQRELRVAGYEIEALDAFAVWRSGAAGS